MIKLITFDLDGTLAELGEWIKPENVLILKKLEDRGIHIAICSGKPTDYLCGLLRQVGLKRPILAGENGSVIQIGIDLPPKDFYILPYSEKAKRSISFIRENIDKLLSNIWYQPNLVGLSKKLAMEMLGEILHIFPEETVCVGNGVNDYPMFEYAGIALGIHVAQENKVDINFPSIHDALSWLLEKTEDYIKI